VRRWRVIIGSLGVVLVVAGFVWAGTGVHSFGHGVTPYGKIVGRATVPQRSATNAVVVTAFDFRGFDTLGEEFILFISVVGVVILLRSLRSEESESERDVASPGPRGSESSRWLGAVLVGAMAVLGAYIVTHGHLTPGGGFQGGVVLMAAVVFLFVGGEYGVLVSVRKASSWMDMADALGAAGFAMIGFGGLIAGAAFLQNFIDKGNSGLLTGGVIPLANIAVGVEVAGALLMVVAELLDQRLLSSET
jgi:multicomponent Na+:H+ antiporter subunit B